MNSRRRPVSAYSEPLDLLLGTLLRVRVLRALDEANDVRRASDLARLTSVDPTALQRTLSPLVDSGLVQRIGNGRGAVYRLNSEHPFASAMRELFAVERERKHAIPRAVQEWAEHTDPAPIAVWLFGSVARHEDKFGSDVDLVLVAPGPAAFPPHANESVPEVARQRSDDLGERLGDALRPIAERMALSPNIIVLLPSELLALEHDQSIMWSDLLEHSESLFGQSAQALVRKLKREKSLALKTRSGPFEE